MRKVSQMPVVLIPVHFDRDIAYCHPSCQRSVVIRPFITEDFMTGIPALPGKHIPATVSIFNYIIYSFDYEIYNKIVINLDCSQNDDCCPRNTRDI